VEQIVREASFKELTFYIYNFSNNYRVGRSDLFSLVWSAFLEHLQQRDVPYILSLHILGKYYLLEDKLYVPFLLKVLGFYALRPDYYQRSMHCSLLNQIKNRFRNVTRYPPAVHTYVKALRRHLLDEMTYLNNAHRFKIILDFMQLGYGIAPSELLEVKTRLLDNDFAVYLCLQSEATLPDKMERLLK
jgi:hypothetical protein